MQMLTRRRPPLPAADAPARPPADARVRRALQSHLPQRLLRALPLGRRRHRAGQLQLRRVVHRLAHRQRRHQHVVLRHVRLHPMRSIARVSQYCAVLWAFHPYTLTAWRGMGVDPCPCRGRWKLISDPEWQGNTNRCPVG